MSKLFLKIIEWHAMKKKNYKMLKINKRLHTCISSFSLLISYRYNDNIWVINVISDYLCFKSYHCSVF